MTPDWLIALAITTVSSAIPLILASQGGVFSERSGVINIALEGMMLMAAFSAAAFGQRSPSMGLAAAIFVGIGFSLCHGLLTQKAGVNHVVSGLGLNLVATGLTRFLSLRYFGDGISVSSPPYWTYVALAFTLPLLAHLFLFRTKAGVLIRATGEKPESVRATGASPVRIRFLALCLCGAFCGLAGSYLSQADAHTFSRDMTAGKGFIALAAVVFGRWNPIGAMAGSLLFGFLYALQSQLQIIGIRLQFLGVEWSSPQILDMVPYFITLLVLLGVAGKTSPPASLGQSSEKLD